ncbi:glycosyl hydrolase [Cellulomonas sp. S1-8]|uniref:glycosyl hydrolase n=1 Tax=Cellulomonas sp. S1-8 TaxID=2904790 RepID=UPI002243A1AF|nr:glycosyl hydrolase [Cellulomonas sp. S1-8]UZN02421.1 glycosyl hydrolase [Cellulomonas sp. S1-8]
MNHAMRGRARTLAAAAAALAVGVAGTLPATAAPTTTPSPEPAPAVHIADPGATAATRSLFAYLDDVRGEQILVGHQHTTSFGLTLTDPDGTTSDLATTYGDFPAVFGWDTLILAGDERPGRQDATTEENIAAFADHIEKAHAIGAVQTISAHMENFATGGSFYDTSGDALRAVLPGGAKNAELTAYLDDIATLAGEVRDEDGELIPIVFRPWHENAGSWFWWGAAFGSPGEYKELFRYTVEYLRDVKGVSNFLYSFSPGGGFGGDADVYLRTYPGDAFVDVLGYDAYDATGSQTFLDGLVADLGMIADLADAKGKVSAYTEFGVTGGVGTSGASPEAWFTKVLAAIEADPRASRSAYLQTWANFDAGQHFVPVGDDALVADFQAFVDDPFTAMSGDLDRDDVFGRDVATTPHPPLVHVVSPADGSRVAASPTILRVRVADLDADAVRVTVAAPGAAEADAVVDLTPDGALWWTALLDLPPALLDNSTRTFTADVLVDGEVVLTDTAHVVLGPRPTFGPGVVDDFEGYGDDTALRAEYVTYGANDIALETGSVGGGEQALRLDYDFATQTYTGIGKQLDGDWSDLNELSLWYDPDGSGNRLVVQLVAGGVSYEAYPSLAGDEPQRVALPFVDWRPAPWDTANADRRITDDDLRAITQLNVYVNAVDGSATSGSLVVDDIAALPGVEPPPLFSDVPTGHPYATEILWMHARGLDDGYADGTYRPQRVVPRHEAATVLHAYAGQGATPSVRRPTYWDVPRSHPAYAAVEWLAAEQITDSRALPLFLPSAPLDRTTAALWLYRLAGEPEVDASTLEFRDVPTRFPARAAIAWATQTGVIEPRSATTYGVLRPVLRQDLARYLYRVEHLPTPLDPVVLFDFADGAQGWTAAAGTATGADGALAVEAPGADGSWVGVTGAWDLTGRTQLVVDAPATTGFDTKLALQVGPSWTWCETAQAGWVNGPSAGDVVLDLTTLTPECAAGLADVKGINLYLNTGSHVLDDVEVR